MDSEWVDPVDIDEALKAVRGKDRLEVVGRVWLLMSESGRVLTSWNRMPGKAEIEVAYECLRSCEGRNGWAAPIRPR